MHEYKLLIYIVKQESELPYYALEKSGDFKTRFENFSCYRD